MRINEIFSSREGEGIEIGTAKIFIRTQGCSVDCLSCDTPLAKNSNLGTEMSVEEIINRVRSLNNSGFIKHVTVTGGSPCEQPQEELIKLLLKLWNEYGYSLSLEESGQVFNQEVMSFCNLLSIDAKSPSTGVKCNLAVHRQIMNTFFCKTQIKVVIEDEKDLEFVQDYLKVFKPKHLVLTPCWKLNETIEDLQKRTQWIYEETFKRRITCLVILQQHKVVFGPKRIGV